MTDNSSKTKLWNHPAVVPFLAGLGVLVPIVLFGLSGSSRELTYSTVVSSPLFSVPDSMPIPVQIVVGGRPTSSAWLTTIDIANTGTSSIATSDFDRAIELKVQPHAVIVGAYLAESNPSSLRPKLTFDTAHVAIAPLLLNSGDRIRIALYTIGPAPEATLDTRISGIAAPRTLGDEAAQSEHQRLVGKCVAIFAGLLVYVTIFLLPGVGAKPKGPEGRDWPVVLLGMLSAIAPILASLEVSHRFRWSLTQLFAVVIGQCLLAALVAFPFARRIRRTLRRSPTAA